MGDDFGDKFGDKFVYSQNLVIFLVMNTVTNFSGKYDLAGAEFKIWPKL